MEIGKEQLRDQLRRRHVAPVYTFFGDETFLRDAAVRYIADLSFGEGDMRDFNETVLSLNVPENILSALAASEQLPMMAAKRVIRVTDVRVAISSNRDTLKEEYEEVIKAYLERPAETSVLILVADELNGNRKLGKLLRQKTTCVSFSRLDDSELRDWAANRFRELKAEADREVVGKVVELVGNDLQRLANEIDKLVTASLPGGRITAELVSVLVPNTREFANFTLTNELVAGRKREALKTLNKSLNDGVEPLALLGLIASNYRRLLIANEMIARGEPRSRVENTARTYGPAFELARRAETRSLAKAIERIARADLAIKTSVGGSGAAGARIQLEMLVCELALL